MDDRLVIMIILIIAICIAIVIVLFLLKKTFSLRKKVITTIEKYSKIFNEKETEFLKRQEKLRTVTQQQEQIQKAIFECASNKINSDKVLKQSLSELSEKLRKQFDADYCSLGRINDNILEDYAIALRDDFINVNRESIEKINKAKISDNLLICEAVKNEENYSYYPENTEFSKYKNSSTYQNEIIYPNEIKNVLIVKLKDESNKPIGYIQFINISDSSKDIEINTFIPEMSKLLHIVNNQENQIKKANDANFINKLIERGHNVDEILNEIFNYFNKEFNVGIITYRIPILNGLINSPLFPLRKCFVDSKIKNHNEIISYYEEQKEIIDFYDLTYHSKINCSNISSIIFNENGNYKTLRENYEIDKYFTSTKTIVVPIIKTITATNSCPKNPNNTCDNYENIECNESCKKLYGIFNLRIYEDIDESTKTIIKDRLRFLSSQITLILNSIMDRKRHLQVKSLKEELNKLNFTKLKDFDMQIVNLVKEVTSSEVCSILRIDHSKNILYLSASTADKILNNGKTKTIEESINNIAFDLDKEEDAIVVRVVKNKQIKYLYNLNYTQEYSEKFIAITPSSKNYKELSLIFLPILNKKKECIGVLECSGKMNKIDNLSNCFWEADKEIAELAVDIAARLSESDAEKLTFLHQLVHELHAPITQIVHECDDLINRLNRHKSIDYYDLKKELKETYNAAFLFKNIVADMEYIYSLSTEHVQYNIQKEEKSIDILMNVVNMFTKEASFSKQIAIKNNIGQMPALNIDKYKIMQACINLMKNAIRYAEPYTDVEIYYKYVVENIEGSSNIYWHEIKFVNYGIGIDPLEKDKIFEMYERGQKAKQLRPTGTGIGLYIVKEIVESHNGFCIIRRYNNPTEVSILLPK